MISVFLEFITFVEPTSLWDWVRFYIIKNYTFTINLCILLEPLNLPHFENVPNVFADFITAG